MRPVKTFAARFSAVFAARIAFPAAERAAAFASLSYTLAFCEDEVALDASEVVNNALNVNLDA